MEKKFNVQVGSKVWIRPATYGRSVKEPFEDTVTKVGRKYFYTGNLNLRPAKFDLETGREETDSNYADMAYNSLQEILDEKEAVTLLSEIRESFSHYRTPNLSLEQLREIKAILNKNNL